MKSKEHLFSLIKEVCRRQSSQDTLGETEGYRKATEVLKDNRKLRKLVILKMGLLMSS